MFKLRQIQDITMDSYGGLQFFHRFIEKTDFEKVVRQELGYRPAQAQYSYKDVITTFAAMCLAGGSYTEDINILRSKQSSLDRKSTRLNSSHVAISYAVFCLNKKKEY